MLKFAWDRAKAAANREKHGVSFEEAASIFSDDFSITFPDPDHSSGEHRWLTFGISLRNRLLVVVHTDRDRTIRIISARKATRHERGIYEHG